MKMEAKKEVDKKPTKKVSKAAGLAAKLSPKSQRKKEQGTSSIAQLKVKIRRDRSKTMALTIFSSRLSFKTTVVKKSLLAQMNTLYTYWQQ